MSSFLRKVNTLIVINTYGFVITLLFKHFNFVNAQLCLYMWGFLCNLFVLHVFAYHQHPSMLQPAKGCVALTFRDVTRACWLLIRLKYFNMEMMGPWRVDGLDLGGKTTWWTKHWSESYKVALEEQRKHPDSLLCLCLHCRKQDIFK